MRKSARIHIPLRFAMPMIWRYARSRITEQIRAVAFIILYLVGFQILVLRTAPANAVQISAGVGMVVIGLAFFLEGLFLGLMPLGERVGMQLPQRCGIAIIIVFGLLLGVGSTLAEPAIAALRAMGLTVTPWDAPLLFRLLETNPGDLVISIGAGVGVAVACGMLRIYYGISIKPFIYVLVLLLLGVSVFCSLDKNLITILGLAWDAGAVTTGAITVPLVLALGIGVARSVGRQDGATAGFGIIALASAFPVIGVIALGMLLNASTPQPLSEKEFFAAENRQIALHLVSSEKNLRAIAFQRGSEQGRRALFDDDHQYERAVQSLADPAMRFELLGQVSLQQWLLQSASAAERALIPATLPHNDHATQTLQAVVGTVLAKGAIPAARAVLPLIALLFVMLFVFLRDKPRRTDELLLGILFTLFGMTLLTGGVRIGLAPLGDQVGRPLPLVFQSSFSEEKRIVLEEFDTTGVFTVFTPDGVPGRYFYFKEQGGTPHPVAFEPASFNPSSRRYEHIVKRPPLFGPDLTLVGIALVLLFAFGMGYGSTMAEPALTTLGHTVEESTVGTIKRVSVVRTVSVGVGIGLLVGVARILYDLPLIWLLIPSYLVLLLLMYLSEEDFAGIALDTGGVTTGSITVPLVLAMGLGIGSKLNIVDGFGILAMASVFPVLTVLMYGLFVRMRQRQLLLGAEAQTDGE